MKANELMVGDLVYNHRNWACPIVEIHKDSAVVIARHYGEEKFELKDLRPIPLTPEILEKNGFVGEGYQLLILDKDDWMEYYHHEHRLRRYWEGIDEWENHSKVRDIVFMCHCYYVHELQHALRMCGVEKEIEL